MNNYINREKIIYLLKLHNNDNRVNHILGVEECALELANKYNANKEDVVIAALFHDYAKSFPLDISLDILKKYEISYDNLEASSVELLHSKVAFAIAKNEFNIYNEDILNSIKYHTTGRANMSLLEKIIFVADAIEKNRNYPKVNLFRSLAYSDLNKAILSIIDNTVCYLIEKEQPIHINTILCRNHILLDIRR